MQYAVKLEPSIPEMMTWAEVCASYPEAWVCLVDVEWGCSDELSIVRGRVVGHARTQRELHALARGARGLDGEAGFYLTTTLDGVPVSPRWLA